jgi:hypothetical protein
MVVLRQLHGAIDDPATIVLSPTDYQRSYEVNELGADLTDIGSQAQTVWSLGVRKNTGGAAGEQFQIDRVSAETTGFSASAKITVKVCGCDARPIRCSRQFPLKTAP